MKIEEKYEEYIRLYDEYLTVLNLASAHEEQLNVIRTYKEKAEKIILASKKIKWESLQELKRNIQNDLDLLEDKTSFSFEADETNEDDMFFADPQTVVDSEDWWSTLNEAYVTDCMAIDSYHARLEEIKYQEERFEQEFEQELQVKLSKFDDWAEQYESGDNISQRKNALLKLKSGMTDYLVSIKDVDGKLKDYFFLPNGASDSVEPVFKIEHHKAPIVFLYDNPDDDADTIYSFIDFVIQHILELNYHKLFYFFINYYGMDISVRQMLRHIKEKTPIENIEFINDFKELSDKINDNLDINFSKCKNSDVDTFNHDLLQRYGEASQEYLRWSILHMYIPEEGNNIGEKIDPDFIGAMEEGARYGFLPVFYIPEDEWNSGKNGNAAIKTIKEKLEKMSYSLYRIDLKGLKLKDYVPQAANEDIDEDVIF